MTVAHQLKIIDNNINANQTQNDLGILAAKISAQSSGDLGKYEYLIGEDLGYKPTVFEQTKFDYSPLGKFFNKALAEDDHEEGLLTRIKNICDKNEELLSAINNQKTEEPDQKHSKTKNNFIYNPNRYFYKYRLSKFSQKSSFESKFDMLEMLYRELNSRLNKTKN